MFGWDEPSMARHSLIQLPERRKKAALFLRDKAGQRGTAVRSMWNAIFGAIGLSGCLACFSLAAYADGATSAHGQVMKLAQATPGSTEWNPTSEQIRDIQVHLKELGFDPGAPDGVSGPRTTAAIQAYQRSLNLDVDGKLTEGLYKRLTGQSSEPAPTSAPPPASAVKAELADQMKAVECLSNIWRFEDARGSSFTLTLLNDGSVQGPSYPRHWRWQSIDQTVEIIYDNGMGLTVTRTGRLDYGLMFGEAKDSRGRSWTWRAQRLKPLSNEQGSDC